MSPAHNVDTQKFISQVFNPYPRNLTLNIPQALGFSHSFDPQNFRQAKARHALTSSGFLKGGDTCSQPTWRSQHPAALLFRWMRQVHVTAGTRSGDQFAVGLTQVGEVCSDCLLL